MMQRIGIDAPVLAHVVPAQQLARFGLKRLANRFEPGCAASFNVIEIDHKRPCAIACDRAERVKVGSARGEIVGVRFKLLSDGIALPLQRFTIGGINPVERL